MKKLFLMACLAVAVGLITPVCDAQNVPIYKEQGGARMVVGDGGSLDVESGGEIDIEDGGALKLDGTEMSASATELNYLDGPTPGVATASKVAVLGANKELDTLRIDDLLSFDPTDTVPAATEGSVYWNDTNDALTVHTGTGWLALSAGTGNNTLDDAYDEGGGGAGKKIDADTGAVEIEVADGSNNPALHLDADDATNDPTVLLIENAADAPNAITIDIDAQTTGRDIEGTGASWHVTGAGVLTAADVQATTATVSGTFTASGGVTLANGGLISNDTPNEIEFTENGEELSFAFTSNTVTLATDTSMDTFALGDVDDLSGVGSIAFDAAPATITLAADGTDDDLTIGVTGAQNISLILSSEGTSNDALQITTTAGGIDILNGGAATEDIDITSTSASINLVAGENAANAIYIHADKGTAETIKIHTDQGDTATSIELLSDDGGITLDTGADDDIELTAGADVNLPTSVGLTFGDDGEKIEGDGTDLTIESSGNLNLVSVVDEVGAVYIRTNAGTAETLKLHADQGDTATSIHLLSDDGGITLDAGADDDIDLIAGADVNLPASIGLTFGDDGEKIEGDGTDLSIVSGGNLNLTSSVDEAAAIYIHADAGTSETIKIHADVGNTATSINLLSDAGGITLDALSNVAITNNATIGGTLIMSKEVRYKVGTSIASPGGGELTLGDGTYFVITGTNNITSIAAASSTEGRLCVLNFAAILTFTDGVNLKLATNFVTTADDVITIICDGTDWYEIARSVN